MLATDRQRPKTIAPAQLQPSACTTAAPSAVATALWTMAPGNGDAPDGEQLLDVELQADAEHEQDDADLGELRGQ